MQHATPAGPNNALTRVVPGAASEALDEAVTCLVNGGLLAFPTETVYGLGARADHDAAVAAIYAAKGRPADHPLIVHVADPEAARPWMASDWSGPGRAWAEQLMARFWPGPVTVIVPRHAGLGATAAGGQASIGLRAPSHPVAQALLRAAGLRGVLGVAAPSANRFGRVSPTRADHVQAEFPTGLLVLDGGDCPEGIESAIVDCTGPHPVLLRPGTVDRLQLERAMGVPLGERHAATPRASGTLASHYAPRARVRLMPSDTLRTALQVLGAASAKGRPPVAVYSRTVVGVPSHLPHHAMPNDAAAAAHELFAVLRQLDASGAPLIWIEQPPDAPAWEGVRDRLRRAAA